MQTERGLSMLRLYPDRQIIVEVIFIYDFYINCKICVWIVSMGSVVVSVYRMFVVLANHVSAGESLVERKSRQSAAMISQHPSTVNLLTIQLLLSLYKCS